MKIGRMGKLSGRPKGDRGRLKPLHRLNELRLRGLRAVARVRARCTEDGPPMASPRIGCATPFRSRVGG